MTTTPANDVHIEGFDVLAPPDQQALGAVLARLSAAFAQRDADLLDGVYTDDADWVNAFGSVKRGNAEIVEYLRGLFADHNFQAGTMAGPPTSALKQVTDDVVIVSIHTQVRGQLLVSGGDIALRDNRSLHVLARQPDGSWKIVSEMFSDVRTDATYEHHS